MYVLLPALHTLLRKVGEVVFEEKALLQVSREAVEPMVWDAVTRLTTDSGVTAMELLQAVAFDSANPSTQDRVLKLVRESDNLDS